MKILLFIGSDISEVRKDRSILVKLIFVMDSLEIVFYRIEMIFEHFCTEGQVLLEFFDFLRHPRIRTDLI